VPTGNLVPAQGALLGLFYGGASGSAATVAATDSLAGRLMDIQLQFYGWTNNWTTQITSDANAGKIAMVKWMPSNIPLDDIISGVQDATIIARATSVASIGRPFFLVFGHEMNGNWYTWSGVLNGSSADKYIAAYKHVHDLFVAHGATSAVWTWCPNNDSVPNQPWNQPVNYYPGDTYVDWTCFDGYNFGNTNGQAWRSVAQVYGGIYPALAALGKPIMVGETASGEVGGDKAAWIDSLLPALKTNYPNIKGYVWFDINKETDWRFASSAASAAAFVRFATDSYMNP
jgi:beta-mannanase